VLAGQDAKAGSRLDKCGAMAGDAQIVVDNLRDGDHGFGVDEGYADDGIVNIKCFDVTDERGVVGSAEFYVTVSISKLFLHDTSIVIISSVRINHKNQ
jgi:hypothetical protein